MPRIFAIGDIHGCNATFRQMLFEEIEIQKEDDIFCIGDYIDRGKNSKGVIDTILNLREEGYTIHTLRGNHEQMMIDSVKGPEQLFQWLENGGIETLNSFQKEAYTEIPERYKIFLESTEYYIETSEYIFVHAGLNFDNEDIFEDKEAMLWIRNFNPMHPRLKKIMVYGHTPKPIEYIISQTSNSINIDGGCVYKDNPIYGKLVAIQLPERKFIAIDCID